MARFGFLIGSLTGSKVRAPSFNSLISRIVFLLPAGVGAHLNVSVELVDDGAAGALPLFTSNVTSFSYLPPAVTSFSPSVVRLAGGAGVNVTLLGGNFGSDAERDGRLAVLVGGAPCVSVARGVQPPFGTVVTCGLSAQAPAGPANVTVTVAGQSGFADSSPGLTTAGGAYSPLLVVCGAGFFGRIGEACLPCPAPGATCAGYNDGVAPSTQGGVLANPADAPFSYPVALPGFYSLSRTCTTVFNGDGSVADACVVADAGGACPPLIRAQFPHRDTCVVGCRPPGACAGANACSPGYVSAPPYFACGSCAPSYFMRDGLCAPCPAVPIVLVVGCIALVMALCALAYALNRKGVALGCLSIGIDYFQVVAILATTSAVWPAQVAQLLLVLSAFNLNIEIVAPECVAPHATFADKFAAVLLVPLALAGAFLAVHGSAVAYKLWAVGRARSQLHRNAPALISTLLGLVYVLYLYETRTLLNVWNCAPASPPDGNTYLPTLAEPCGVPGGVQAALLPWAIIGLVAYTGGYPAFLAWNWVAHRELIMEDQLLAKGLGDDRLSNPHAYAFRKAYGGTYARFKPHMAYWGVMVAARKAAIAGAIVAFNTQPTFQLAGCLFVLLCAYGLQVRLTPYMSAEAFEGVLAEHERAAMTGASMVTSGVSMRRVVSGRSRVIS